MKESGIVKNIMLAVSAIGARVFRNNIGIAKYANGTMVRYGICNPGGSDLIGYHTIAITPDMIGKKVAVFLAIEVKNATGRLKPEQRSFIDTIVKAGGIAGVAKNEQEALDLIKIYCDISNPTGY